MILIPFSWWSSELRINFMSIVCLFSFVGLNPQISGCVLNRFCTTCRCFHSAATQSNSSGSLAHLIKVYLKVIPFIEWWIHLMAWSVGHSVHSNVHIYRLIATLLTLIIKTHYKLHIFIRDYDFEYVGGGAGGGEWWTNQILNCIQVFMKIMKQIIRINIDIHLYRKYEYVCLDIQF